MALQTIQQRIDKLTLKIEKIEHAIDMILTVGQSSSFGGQTSNTQADLDRLEALLSKKQGELNRLEGLLAGVNVSPRFIVAETSIVN